MKSLVICLITNQILLQNISGINGCPYRLGAVSGKERVIGGKDYDNPWFMKEVLQ